MVRALALGGPLLWHKVMTHLHPHPEHLPLPAWWHLWPIPELEQVAPEVKVSSPVLPPAEWFGASHSTPLGLALITDTSSSQKTLTHSKKHVAHCTQRRKHTYR